MLKTFQKELRKNQTDAEIQLWQQLRNRRLKGFKFRRQHVLQGYIVDFVCLEERLIIELDGGQHSEQVEYDTARTKKLAKLEFRVLRFWNNDVLNNQKVVLESIYFDLVKEP